MNQLRIAFIGFGEVGTTFARDFANLGGYDLSAFDILFHTPGARPAMIEKATALGVRFCNSASMAAEGADVVISAVTASSAYDVAKEANSYLKPGQYFLDINSVSPATKRHDAKAIESSGAFYVEAAVMAPVAPYGIRVPIVLGGLHTEKFKALFGDAMRLEIGERDIGKASALKMCRSVMVKGLEALAVECFLAARLYGVEDRVLSSLQESYPGVDWNALVGYNIGRTIAHGRRRAAEMRESAGAVEDTGLEPLMASATAARIDWMAEQTEAHPQLREQNDEDWRATLDLITTGANLRRPSRT